MFYCSQEIDFGKTIFLVYDPLPGYTDTFVKTITQNISYDLVLQVNCDM